MKRYTPNNWQTGDIITAAKLNNMERGIEDGNSPLVITIINTFEGTTDKTAQEVYTALQNNTPIILVWDNDPHYPNGATTYQTGREPSDPIYQEIYAIDLNKDGWVQRCCVSYQVDSNREPVNPTAAVDFSVISFTGLVKA